MAIALTKELLTTEAEIQAERLVKSDKSDGTTIKTQLRKFYNDFLLLKNKADLKN